MMMRSEVMRLFVLALVFGLASPLVVRGQDTERKEDATKQEEAPAAEPAAQPDNKGEPVSEQPLAKEDAVSADSPAARFAAKLEEWKKLLQEMRATKTEYDEASDAEVPAVLERWNALLARGATLIDELREVGGKAYAVAPDSDRELTRFLVKILEDDIQRDRYEQAAELSRIMLDNGCDVNDVYSWGGMAAFCTNDFDRAEQYFQEAQNRGGLTQEANRFAGLLADYKQYWETEKVIREKEAEANDLPRVKIATSKGDVVIELFENEAPGAVGNFISLVEKGFYDGLSFHRVLPGFMAQGGCPLGTGTGGPGYNIYCECYQENAREHFRGTLSMAHAGKDSGGSQFFITFVPTPHLNGRHTAFGRVIEGMDVLAELQRINPDDADKPAPDRIVKMEVLRKRDHEYQPNKVE